MKTEGEIRRLIEDDKLKEALEIFTQIRKGRKNQTTISQIKARLRELDNKEKHGLIQRSDYVFERNSIRKSILDIFEENSIDEKKLPSRNKKIFLGVSIGIVILVTLAFMHFFDTPVSLKEKLVNQEGCVGLDADYKKKPKLDYIKNENYDKTTLEITKQHLRSIELKIINKYGDLEIKNLWIELKKCFKCIPADLYLNDEYADNNYYLPLTQNANIYSLLPSTFSNNRESFLIDNESVKTFYIRFASQNYNAYEIKACANIYDGLFHKSYYIESDSFLYFGRKCLEVTGDTIPVSTFEPEIEPYLYKLMTGNLWSNFLRSPDDLNQKAYCQISKILNLPIEDLNQVIYENDTRPFKNLENYPEPYDEILFVVAKRLHENIF